MRMAINQKPVAVGLDVVLPKSPPVPNRLAELDRV